jgi:hypothetical protein
MFLIDIVGHSRAATERFALSIAPRMACASLMSARFFR